MRVPTRGLWSPALSPCPQDEQRFRQSCSLNLVSCSALGKRCRDLLVQLYLQRPELRVPVPEVLLHSEGAAGSSVCKVRPGVGFWGRFCPFLGGRTQTGRCGQALSQTSKERAWGDLMAGPSAEAVAPPAPPV